MREVFKGQAEKCLKSAYIPLDKTQALATL